MKRSTWVIFSLIILVGVILRFVNLAEIPPGLYHDEAYSGLDALSVLRGAGFPIFFEGNGGREPFFIYLHALSIALFGTTSFALRLPAAIIGIITLPVFFILVRALNAQRKNSVLIALVATAGLATSYWHVNFSRMGWRTVSLPLLACLAFYFFWRARNTGRWSDHLLTGVFLGSSLYTYLSARFLPIVIACFWLIEIIMHLCSRRDALWSWRLFLRNAAIVIGVSSIVFLPLSLYFAGHPQALFFRVADVTLAGQGDSLQAIAGNISRVLRMFYQTGDPEWRHGIAGRPVLDWITGIPFALGVVSSVWRWRNLESWFAFLWFGILLLPTVLSKDAPDLQRAIGALPAMYIFIAWGMTWLIEWVSQWGSMRLGGVALAAIAILLVGSGSITARDYFGVWANDRHAYADYQGGLVELAGLLNSERNINIILPVELYAHPTVHFLTLPRYAETRSIFDLSPAEQNQLFTRETWAIMPADDESQSFVLLQGNQAILLDPNAHVSLKPASPSTIWQDKWGKTPMVEFPVIHLDNLVDPTHFTPIKANFDQRLFLVGYAMNRVIVPGDPYFITLYWSSPKGIQQSLVRFVHLLDWKGDVVVGVDSSILYEFNPGLFPPDQIIPDAVVLKIDPSLSPGKYSLEVGLYYPANDSRSSVWMDGERMSDDRVVLSAKVAVPDQGESPTQHLDAQFDNSIVLDGVTLSSVTFKPGDLVSLKLFWRSMRTVQRDYTIFVHLLDDQGQIIAQSDRQPRGGTYPTSIWDAGENILDEVELKVPTNAPVGHSRIVLGLYDGATGRRLTVTSHGGQMIGDALELEVPLEVNSH